MSASSAMQHVELDETVDAPADVADPPARRRGRWWGAVGGAAAVLVTALVVTQTALDARERAAQERLAATPGVVRPVDADVGVLWRPDPAAQAVLLQGVDAGTAMVGLAVADDGSQAFVGLDQRTGEQRFSTPLVGPDEARARSLDRSAAGTCVPVPGAEGAPAQAACLVSDGFVQYGDEGVETRRPATTTRVVVLDTGDGHVVADEPAPGATALAALAGLAVVSVPDAGITARDLLTGDVRWTYVPPAPGPDRRSFAGSTRLFAAGGVVGVAVPGWTAAVLSSSGELLRASQPGDADVVVDPVAGRLALLSSSGSGALRSTLTQRSRGDVELPGGLLPLTVDDGSVPGLVLTSDVSLRAWDADTGDARWKADVVASVNALVLGGRVYLSTQNGVVALDGRTGEVVWRGETTEGNVPGFLATDGEHLVVADQPVVGGPRSELVALALDDGHAAWRVPFPDGLRSSVAVGHLLLGWGDDGRLVVLG
ncbi:outer membrane protein assembly factor BamB family protein [Cellulomonas sp. P5_E12]